MGDDVLLSIEILTVWVGLAAFIVSYASLSGMAWIRNEAGRMLMSLAGAAFLLLTLGAAQVLWPDFTGRGLIRRISYGLLIIGVVWLNSLLWRRQLRSRRGRREADEAALADALRNWRHDDRESENPPGGLADRPDRAVRVDPER